MADQLQTRGPPFDERLAPPSQKRQRPRVSDKETTRDRRFHAKCVKMMTTAAPIIPKTAGRNNG